MTESPSFSARARPAPVRVRVVLFDLDDTLFAHRAAVDAGIIDHLRTLGTPYRVTDPTAEVAFWHQLEERHYHRYLAGELDYAGQQRARAQQYALRHGVEIDDDAASAWFAAYFAHYVGNWGLHDDALPCLDALRNELPGVRFGLITNGDSDYQLRKVDTIGLSSHVDHIVASGAIGIVKPDPRIFEHACTLFGVSPREAAYVGDRIDTDALGAARAGLAGIWINRAGVRTPAGHAIEAAQLGIRQIASLLELAPLLAA